MKIKDILEASGYIPRNAKEAKDPRWSSSLTVDVHTDTMRKQLAAFYPTTAPDDGQEQIEEANTIMIDKQLNEGQGSINVETQYDISRIQKLAGLANSSTVAGTPVAEAIYDDIHGEQATEVAAELEQQVEQLTQLLNEIEQTIKTYLPKEYASMKDYGLASIKSAIGGYGYAGSRMSKTLAGLIEDLKDHGYGGE